MTVSPFKSMTTSESTTAPAVSAPVTAPAPQELHKSLHDNAKGEVTRLKSLSGDSLRSAFAEVLRNFAQYAPAKPEFSANKAERKRQMSEFKREDTVFRSAVGILVRFGEDVETAESKLRHGYSVSASGIINLRRNEVFTLRPAKGGRVSV